MDGAFADGIISEAEAIAIEKYLNTINETMAKIEVSYDKVYKNPFLEEGSSKTSLKSNMDNLINARNRLVNAINIAIAGDGATQREKEDVDYYFKSFNSAIGLFQNALENAQLAIQRKIKNDSESLAEESAYLKRALGQTTTKDGGLLLTSMIQLGEETNGTYVAKAGINGIALKNEKSVAAWYGGTLQQAIAGSAATVFKMDGSGHMAKGNIKWDIEGKTTINSSINAKEGEIAGFEITKEGIKYDGSYGGAPVVSIESSTAKAILGKKFLFNKNYRDSYCQLYIENNENPSDYLDDKAVSVGVLIKSNYSTSKSSRKIGVYTQDSIWTRNLFQYASVARAVYQTKNNITRFYVDGSDSEFIFNFTNATNWLLLNTTSNLIEVSLPTLDAFRNMINVYADGRSDSDLNNYIRNTLGLVFTIAIQKENNANLRISGNSNFPILNNNGGVWGGTYGYVDMNSGDTITLMYKNSNYYLVNRMY